MIQPELTLYKINKAKTLKRVCAWCGKIMGEGDGFITHGICPPCAEELLASYRAPRKRDAQNPPKPPHRPH